MEVVNKHLWIYALVIAFEIKLHFIKNITIIRLILLSIVSLFTIFLQPEIKWNPTWYWSTSRAATLIYGHQRNSLDYGILLMLSNLSKLQVTFLWWPQVILRKLSHHYIFWSWPSTSRWTHFFLGEYIKLGYV